LYDKDAIMRNYDAYKPRLRRLKGVNIGGYDGNYAWEKSVRLSLLSSPFASVIVLSRTFATRLSTQQRTRA